MRLRRKDTEIQDMKTESKQHNRRWRTATRQCRSRIKCTEEDEEEW